MWKVNCCKKRHRIVFTPRGSLLFLDHPTRADWEKVETLEALHRQMSPSKESYACRCYQIREEWRRALTTQTVKESREDPRKHFLGILSNLPNHPGVSLYSATPQLNEELRLCRSAKKMEKLLQFRNFRDPETNRSLVETGDGMGMQDLLVELALFHTCRDEVKRKQHRYWFRDVPSFICDSMKIRRPRVLDRRRRKRREVLERFSHPSSSNLFLSKSSLSRARFEGLTFVEAVPEDIRKHAVDNSLPVRALYMGHKLDRWGHPSDAQTFWVWAFYDLDGRWWLKDDDEKIYQEIRK